MSGPPPPGAAAGHAIEWVGLDGDDTLWHSESMFERTHEQLRALLAPYCPAEAFDERLLSRERANLELFGYGAKSFTIATIETAIELSGGRVTTREIQRIIDLGKELIAHPVELCEGVAEGVAALARRYRLVLVTKGDLFHQESKIARSGLVEHFSRIHIVAEKDAETYRRVLDACGVAAQHFVMIGNSVVSDVLPVLGIGGRALHVPYPLTWALERAEPPVGEERFRSVDGLAHAAAVLEHW